MAILIKCNASDVAPGDELTFTLRKEKGLRLSRGQEAFVWVSERPRQEPKGTGLEMRGRISSWQAVAGESVTVTIRIETRLANGLGMNALAQINSESARALHQRIGRMRRRLIWQLSRADRQVLHGASQVLVPRNIDEMAAIERRLNQQVLRSLRDPAGRRARLRGARPQPRATYVLTRVFIRNADVIAEVLSRASGRCERCDSRAPFARRSDNSPYLEVHHRVTLADGGNDTVENAIALCPNCHREAHFGAVSNGGQ
jgi:hypothetical protein